MPTKFTTWRPDTCGCELVYSWDAATSEDARVHTPHSTVRACPGHQGKTVGEHHAVVVEENHRKNVVHSLVLAHPDLSREVPDHAHLPARDRGREVLPGVEFTFSFDAARVLHITLSGPGVEKRHRDAIQQQASDALGQGVVRVA